MPERIRYFRVNSHVTLSPPNSCGFKLFLYGGRLPAAADLCDEAIRNALRIAIETVRVARPFVIDTWVWLLDHLHCVWTLPDGDADFSTRWMIIKRAVSLACREDYRCADWVAALKLKHRESTIWQRRLWKHQIRDENDLARQIDYIHFNPVKHGHVQYAVD